MKRNAVFFEAWTASFTVLLAMRCGFGLVGDDFYVFYIDFLHCDASLKNLDVALLLQQVWEIEVFVAHTENRSTVAICTFFDTTSA